MPPPAEIVIDTRPLWQLLISRGRQPLMLAIGVLLYWSVRTLPAPEGLTAEGQAALAVFALCVFYWIFSVLPLMITGLLAITLIPLSGIMSAGQAYALFGNEAVFFILGAFILAAAMMRSGLSARIAVLILDRFHGTPGRLLLTIFLLNAVMAFFMSEHAVAAMNFPIIVEIAAVLRLNPRRSNYGKSLFMAMAWGTTIGGVATLLGGARAPLALAMLRESTGQSFSFAEWSAAIWPTVAVMLCVGYFTLTRFFPTDVASVEAVEATLREKRLKMGRASYRQRAVGLVMFATFVAWVVGGEAFGLANIALAAVIVLFVLQLVSWRDVEAYVNWGVLLMYGGAICLGAAISKSGAAAWIAHHTILNWAGDPRAVVLVLSLLSLVLTEAMSNTAVVALLMPVSLGIAEAFGMDPRVITLAIAVPAGLAFALPVGTPANAIAYSSGYLRVRDIMVPGAMLAFCAWIVFNLMANFYWPLLGIRIQ
jgi:sodium-dependent dicarboxylate transporter 2/3/5